MAECPSVCEQLHLPLQSGSTRILKAMRRTYSRQRYLELVERIRDAVPGIALTTDIIVGFPGETEDGLRRDARGGGRGVLRPRLHLRLLAPPRHRCGRDGGPGSRGRQADEIVRLVDLVQEHAARHNARLVGSMQEVLVEGRSRTDHDVWRGRTRTNKTVNFTGSAEPGELVDVLVERSSSQTLTGRRRGSRRRAVSALAVFGPTASGKSQAALELARALDGEIVSCDAMQMYRGLPILTNQPSVAELEAGPAPPGRRLGARTPRLGGRVR